MVMRLHLEDGAVPSPAPRVAAAAAPRAPRPPRTGVQRLKQPDREPAGTDYVDSQLALNIVAAAVKGLRSDESERRPPTLPPAFAAPRAAGRARARKVLDERIFASIRREFPGWDSYDLMGRFDTFLGKTPPEMGPCAR